MIQESAKLPKDKRSDKEDFLKQNNRILTLSRIVKEEKIQEIKSLPSTIFKTLIFTKSNKEV